MTSKAVHFKVHNKILIKTTITQKVLCLIILILIFIFIF